MSNEGYVDVSNLLLFAGESELPASEQAKAVLVLNTLWAREKNGLDCLSVTEIADTVQDVYKLQLLTPEVERVLELLKEKQVVTACDERERKITLSERARTDLKQGEDEYHNLFKDAKKEFLDYARHYWEHNPDTLWVHVTQNLQSIMQQHLNLKIYSQNKPLSAPGELAIRTFIYLANKESSSACAKLMELWASKAILAHLLSVDSEFEKLIATFHSKNQTAVLLDTNILIGLFGAAGDASLERLLSEFTHIANRLNLQPLIVTRLTLGEYQHAVRKFKRDIESVRRTQFENAEDLAPSLLKGYLQGKMNLEEFVAYFSDVQTLLENVYREYSVRISVQAHIDELYFSTCDTRGTREPLSRDQRFFCANAVKIEELIEKLMPHKIEKGPEVIKHDSMLLAYLLLMNNNAESSADARALLISEDKSLKRLDALLMRETGRNIPYVWTISEFITNFGIFITRTEDLAQLMKDILNLAYVSTLPTSLPTLRAIEELVARLQSQPKWSARQIIGLVLERAGDAIISESPTQQEIHVHFSEQVIGALNKINEEFKKDRYEYQLKVSKLSSRKDSLSKLNRELRDISEGIRKLKARYNLLQSALKTLTFGTSLPFLPSIIVVAISLATHFLFIRGLIWLEFFAFALMLILATSTFFGLQLLYNHTRDELAAKEDRLAETQSEVEKLQAEIAELSSSLGIENDRP